MKPSPLQTPKPSIRGKSRLYDSNSGEGKNAGSKSLIPSSESNSGDLTPKESKFIRNLSSVFDGTADPSSPSQSDPELVLETQELMKPSPFQTPKPSICGKSTPYDSNSDEGKDASHPASLLLESDCTTADLYSPSPSDPDLVLKTLDPESPISSITADSGITETKGVVTIAACRSETRKSSMDAISGGKKGKLVVDQFFWAMLQMALTVILISLIAMLHIKLMAVSRDSVAADYGLEGSFFDFVPT